MVKLRTRVRRFPGYSGERDGVGSWKTGKRDDFMVIVERKIISW